MKKTKINIVSGFLSKNYSKSPMTFPRPSS